MKSTRHVDEVAHGKVLEVELHGKLDRRDFDFFVPETERLIKKFGRIRILAIMREFAGWDAGAFWEELKWEAQHFNHIERLAIVGDESWQQWMAGFCKPFTSAEVKFFPLEALDQAHAWMNS